jgi:hypothetical protein
MAVTTWWDDAFEDIPFSTWFWGYNHNINMLADSSGIFTQRTDAHRFLVFGTPNGNYQLYRIPAGDGHSPQLLLKTPVRLWGAEENVPGRPSIVFEANATYIFTDSDDTPNWGGASNLLAISPPCGNWYTHVYYIPPIPDIINISGIKTDSDTGEPLGGWTITLENSLGATQSVLTDISGAYSFSGLPLDTYSVYETIQEGWTCVTPDATGRYDGITASVGSGTTNFVRNFANYHPEPPLPPPPPDIINIRGNKTNGLTGEVLPGWTITLANLYAIISQVQTDLQGNYAFLGLPRDYYAVYETLKPGWYCSLPGAGLRYDGITSVEGSGTVDFVRNFVNNFLPITRSQTWGILAGIQADLQKAAAIRAAIATTPELPISIYAAVQAQLDLPIEIHATVMGERERSLPIRAAVRAEPTLSPAIIAVVGKDFDLLPIMRAAIKGDAEVHCHLKAAVFGETEKSVGIVAFVVNTRVDHILLEMENLWPQELDLRSTPNWASKVKDYRASNLSARDS